MLAISMITKNAGATLDRALDPFAGVADQIVVADTGSTDDTLAVLARHGATVTPFAWRDDFAAARNAALENVRTDWFLSLDSDEWVSPAEARAIKGLTGRTDVDAFLFTTMNFLPEPESGSLPTEGDDRTIAPAWFSSEKIRVARTGVTWEGPVHELLEFDARRRGYRVAAAPIQIRHDGLLSGNRGGHYDRIAEKAVREGTAHAGIIHALGMSAARAGRWKEAIALFKKAIAKEPAFTPPVLWLGRILHHHGKSAEAITVLQEGLRGCLLKNEIIALLIEIHRALGEDRCVDVIKELGDSLYPGDSHIAAASR